MKSSICEVLSPVLEFMGNTEEVGRPGSRPSPAAGVLTPQGQLQRAKALKVY